MLSNIESSMVEHFTLAGTPDATLSVLLYNDVTNSKQLQERLVTGDLPAECAILNATLIPDIFLLRLAAEVALQAQQGGTLRTRALHSEIVYNLSGSRHITESFRRYGITEKVSSVLVARINALPNEMESIRESVQGEVVPLSTLSDLADRELLVKYHKLAGPALQMSTLVDAIACHMATRDVL